MRALFLFLLCLVMRAQLPFVLLPPKTSTVTDATTGAPVTVRIGAFHVSPSEVTQADYLLIAGRNPSIHRGDDRPVENVTWWDAIRYCNLRSMAEKLEPCYDLATGRCDRSRNGYRLLTDAEWAYAAGSAQTGHLGPAQTKNSSELAEYVRTHGSQPVAQGQPNAHGLYDMTGNVWEWVQDYHDPSGAVSPAGPGLGVARVIRGGSFASTSSRWSRGYRSSMQPDHRSRYTGFRVCRTAAQPLRPAYDSSWMKPYQDVPAALKDQTGGLTPLGDRAAIRRKWADVLGKPESPAPPVSVREVVVHEEPSYTGRLMYLQVEPDAWEKIYLMLPRDWTHTQPLPVVIVPYYDVDTPAGQNLGGRVLTPLGTRAFGHLAVQMGFAAVAIRWFGESYGEHYSEAVANLKRRHPKLTGLGKWVWDSQRLLDYLETLPEVDSKRIGMIGHSLGGKMTLYAAAMDERIRAAVSSEPGIGLSFSNYDDFWYLGEALSRLPKGTDHHELLALIAPRPFLLIGGDSADDDRSWHYVNAARSVYRQLGEPDRIGYFNHRKGHSPTPESVHLAMEWLRRFLEPPEQAP